MTSALSAATPSRHDRIEVERWPSEIPLLMITGLIGLAIWGALILSRIGLVYAAFFGLFYLVAHAVLIAHIRGSSVRLGPDQFPELYGAVESIARRMELTPMPEVYLMQAGGDLNAFATKFFRGRFVVLYSDLLEACGDNLAARDMIIAHELGHLKAGHLDLRWLLAPAYLLPWPGRALSRVREYTCDRYGLAGAADTDGALKGLTILAAGGKLGPYVNREAMVRQTESLNTGMMAIAEWYMSHPPLAKRLAALDAGLARVATSTAGAGLRGAALGVATGIALLVATGWV